MADTGEAMKRTHSPGSAGCVFSSRLLAHTACPGTSHTACVCQLPKPPWDLTPTDMYFMEKNTGDYIMGKERREREGKGEREETKREEKEGCGGRGERQGRSDGRRL